MDLPRMTQPPAIPGYDVSDLIGFGGSGEVWRAVEESSGDTVALKRLRGRSGESAERLHREASALTRVAGPHVIGVRDVVVTGDDAVMVLDYAYGGSLAGILGVRGHVSAMELVTIVAPIAAALANAHEHHMIHGDITPSNILFDEDGRPLLADFGIAHLLHTRIERIEGTDDYLDPALRAGAMPSAASDVYGLGAVAFTALTGEPPPAATGSLVMDFPETTPAAMRELIEAAISPVPENRPPARDLGELMLESSAAAPVRLVQPVPVRPVAVTQPVAPRPSAAAPVSERDDAGEWDDDFRERWVRRGLVGAAAVAAVAFCVGAGMLWSARSGSSHAQRLAPVGEGPSPIAAPRVAAASGRTRADRQVVASLGPSALHTAAPRLMSSPNGTVAASVTTSGVVSSGAQTPSARTAWIEVVRQLDAARVAAFAHVDKDRLDDVYVPGASGRATDAQEIDSLAGRGLHADGLTATVSGVRLERGSSGAATLRVRDELSSYRLVDAAGQVQATGHGRAARWFTIQLTRTAAGWRVSAVSA